jgi:hypothetical protein
MEALEELGRSALTLDHWPFFMITLVFAVIGQFTSKHLFTRARAYRKGKMQWLWWWGRESLMLHPIVTGALLGLAWPDPERVGWEGLYGAGYFAGAGACSLFLFALIRGIAKKRGIKLTLPGESVPPKKDG